MDNRTTYPLPTVPSPPQLPGYTLVPRPPLLTAISDFHLSLFLPILAYWLLSTIYFLISHFNLFSQYCLHTPAEFKARNRATVFDVLRSVILQQVLQTAWGLFLGHALLGSGEMMGREEYDVAAWAMRVRGIESLLFKALVTSGAVLGVNLRGWEGRIRLNGFNFSLVDSSTKWELLVGNFIYHIVVPTFQFGTAICFSDAWQYMWHRAMHENKWMYRNLHAQHHRLYVPYAFGAFYNTLSEAFIVDTVGTTISMYLSGLSTRQATVFSTISVLKGVDDHCGYKLPWDPLQWLGEQGTEFHDIHHQSWGANTNYSQLYTTFWDHIFGTVCLRSEMEKQALYKKGIHDAEVKAKKATYVRFLDVETLE